MPAIDIDRDAAHDAAQRELSKPIYPRQSLMDEITDRISGFLFVLLRTSRHVTGGWVTVTVLAIVLASVVVVTIRIARRTMRTNRGGDYELFDACQLTAAQHRATAEAFAAEGNWSAAIRHRLRAVTRQLEETNVLTPVPGRTANELAHDAGDALPHLAAELSQAATAFNDVTYGERPGTQAAYQMIADLDDHLRSRSVASPDVAQPVVSDSWAKVR